MKNNTETTIRRSQMAKKIESSWEQGLCYFGMIQGNVCICIYMYTYIDS